MTTLPKGSHWPGVTKQSPCPICRKPDRCKIAPDGARVLCFRVEDGCERPVHGGECWLHRLNGPRDASRAVPVLSVESLGNGLDDAHLEAGPGAMRLRRFWAKGVPS